MDDDDGPSHVSVMSTPKHDFLEGQDVFITTIRNAAAEPSILFASSIEAILPAEDGDLILADGLRFRPDAAGAFTARSGNWTLTLVARTDETIAQAKAHGAVLREARKARTAEAARRAANIRAGTDAVGAAQHGLDSWERQKTWQERDLRSAQATLAAAQRKVDAHPTELAQRQEKLRLAQAALEAVRRENG